MFRRSVISILIFLLAACNLSVPEVTPTLAPTRTPSPTAQATNTPLPTVVILAASETPTPLPTDTQTPTLTPTTAASLTLTPTATLTATSTDQPSQTPSLTPTSTLTPTPTSTDAPTATQTFTPAPTDTPVPTATNTLPPTVTPLPIFPTDTPTLTSTPTVTPSITVPPTLTPLPTLTSTPSSTPRPSPTPTRTLSPAEMESFATPQTTGATEQPAQPTLPPTLDVTPTFITAEAASTDQGIISPVPADTTPDGSIATSTPTEFPTVALQVTLAPLVTAGPAVTIVPQNPQTLAFALSTNGGVTSTSFNLLNDTTLFARNPVDPNLYVSTDSSGNMYLTGVNGAGAYRPDMSPFSVFPAIPPDENSSFVSAVAWSPDGRYLAFIVDGDKVADDGVWLYQPGVSVPAQLLVDCSSPNFPGCGIVSNPFDPDLWESISLEWSPLSDALLVTVFLPAENRYGLVVLPLGQNRSERPRVHRYDYGSWSLDGSRILVSGRGEDGHVFVGWLNRDGSFSELVYDAEAAGLWMGFAHQSRDGQVYALGAPGDRGGPREPLRIYNMNGVALTEPIGAGFPERVEWSPDGAAVFVQTGGRQYIASINGSIQDITGQVAGARAVNWVDGALPPGSSFAPPGESAPPFVPVGATAAPELPVGVIENNPYGYQPGQQLRVQVAELNVRSGPGISYSFIRNPLQPGEYVAILAGPVTADGIVWWQVQTADGIVGWIAGEINGGATLGN